MIDRRAFLGAAACGVMGLGLSGCSQVEGGDAGSSDDVPPSWVTCRIGKPSAIDPLLVSDRFGLQVLHALFCPLTRIVDGVATVSYTHLDVYKRQTRRRMSGSTASTIPIRPSRFSRTLATPQTPMASAVLRLR